MKPAPLLVFLDTEFTGFTADPKLMSIGMVTADGRQEFYAEIEMGDGWTFQDCSEFVRREVLPLMQGGELLATREEVRHLLIDWFASIPGPCQIACDSATDMRLLRQILGDDWPDQLDRHHHDLRGLIDSTAFDHGVEEYFRHAHAQPHHALHDARANRRGWLSSGTAASRNGTGNQEESSPLQATLDDWPEEDAPITLTARESVQIRELIEHPPPRNKRFREMMARHEEWERESRNSGKPTEDPPAAPAWLTQKEVDEALRQINNVPLAVDQHHFKRRERIEALAVALAGSDDEMLDRCETLLGIRPRVPRRLAWWERWWAIAPVLLGLSAVAGWNDPGLGIVSLLMTGLSLAIFYAIQRSKQKRGLIA